MDIHLDLSGATGKAAGTTLADYDFEPNTVLFQTSQGSVFGNPAFDPDANAVYRFEYGSSRVASAAA